MLDHDCLSEATLAELASKAQVNPRTIVRRLANVPVRPTLAARIDPVLAAYGIKRRGDV